MRFNLSSTRHRDRLRCLSALTIVGLSALSASPAVAVMPACGWDTNGSAAGPMTGVPLDSPIRIESAVLYDDCGVSDALAAVSASVTTGDQTVAGAVGFNATIGSLYWLADAPLTANTTYTLTVTFDNESVERFTMGDPDDAVITFETGAEPLPPPTAAQVTATALTERRRSNIACCATPYACSADPRECDYCWADSFYYVPAVDVTYTPTSTGNSYYHRVAKGPPFGWLERDVGSARATPSANPVSVQVAFDEGAFPACVRVDAVSMIDDSVVAEGEVVCHQQTDLQPLEREGVPTPDFGQCSDPGAYADHPLNPSGSASADGCAAGSSDLPAPVILALTVLGLLVTRRRS